ncbi:MAG: cell division protein ZapB [SAR324 cluster bacterium]|nr:cell division protein ZapB [SAR324 cluster bacterium]
MSDLLSRLESRIRQAVEKIEEYQLEIDNLKEQNTVLEAERQEMHDKLALLIDSFEELEAAADECESSAEITEEIEETVEAAEEETAEEIEAANMESSEDNSQDVDVSHHNSHNSVNSYAASPW